MRHLLLTILLGFSSWAFAQPSAFEADTLSAFKPRTAQEFARPADHFQFAVIGDLTGGYRSGVFPLAVDKANAIVPDFVMSVGDLIEGYTYDTAQIQRWWNQFDKWVGALDMPFFYVPGNHDLSNAFFELKLPSQQGVRLGFSPTDSLLVDVQDNWPIEGELKAIRNKKGFVAELKLPIAHLEQLNAAPLKQFQLQWAVYDHDRLEDQYKGTKALWRAPFPGSGTFLLPLTKP